MKTRMGAGRRMLAAGMLAAAWAAGGEAGAQGPSQLPFQDIYRRPNVSPYVQMQQMGTNPLQAQSIYQQQVLPQMQQQQMRIEQLTQQRQMSRMQNQVTRIQQDTRARQIDPTIRPTGHASTYMNYSHYYRQR